VTILERIEAIENPVERFEYFRAHRAEIATALRRRQLVETHGVRTDIERWLSQRVASAAQTAQVLKLSASMLSQVRSGSRNLSCENTQLLKLLTK